MYRYYVVVEKSITRNRLAKILYLEMPLSSPQITWKSVWSFCISSLLSLSSLSLYLHPQAQRSEIIPPGILASDAGNTQRGEKESTHTRYSTPAGKIMSMY